MFNSVSDKAAPPQVYWVIGGEYKTLAFEALVEGTEHVEGPFDSFEDAVSAWRRLAEETRSRATTRFSVASEQRAAL